MSSIELPKQVKIYTDGASRGNPGPASIGIVFYDEADNRVSDYKESLGDQTNNYAEYMAVIKALELCQQAGVSSAQFYCDSQLLVKQMLGEYKVKAPQIKDLYLKAKALTDSLDRVGFNHVRREFNKEADALANEALDGF